MIAVQVRLLQIERKKKEEAERLHREEEERLRQKMREVEAKREAERLHQERLKKIEDDKKRDEERREEERRMRVKEVKKMEEEAKQRRDMPVEDSKVVEEMFGFLGDQQAGEIDPCKFYSAFCQHKIKRATYNNSEEEFCNIAIYHIREHTYIDPSLTYIYRETFSSLRTYSWTISGCFSYCHTRACSHSNVPYSCARG